MIATLTGVLAEAGGTTVVIQTDTGVGYAVHLPLGVFERLPAPGARVTLHTELVVREDGWTLYGFDRPSERHIFQRLLDAGGFGPRLALALLSTLGPDRTVASIQRKDVAALSTVSGIGKKKAERLILELHDRFKDLSVDSTLPRPQAADAVQALSGLGYSAAEAERAVRGVLDGADHLELSELIRRALQKLTGTSGGP